MDILSYNRAAWDKFVAQGNRWTVPVSSEEIALARRGQWSIVLTPVKPVPRDWFPDLDDLDVLALGSGGGQQGPILAARGAHVTVFDNSIPYSDVTSLSDEERRRYTEPGEPLAFGHTLEDQIGGQTDAGFVIAGFYGDRHVDDDVVSRYMPCFGATRAVKWP